MKRRLCAWTAALLVLCLAACLAEDGGSVFDLAALEEDETLYVFEDGNGIDIIYRDMDQPWEGVCSEGEVSLFLDYAELANEDAVVLRITVSVVLEDLLAADTLRLTLDGREWRFAVTPLASEYDQIFMEDYPVCLAGESLSLLQALAGSGPHTLLFELAGERTISGSVTVPGDAVRAIRDRWIALGGEKQDLTRVERRWSPLP